MSLTRRTTHTTTAAMTAASPPLYARIPEEEVPTTMKERTLEGFGPRLAELRKARGMTQTELGAKVGVSYRMIAHYERPDAQPPGPILPDLARALRVTADELLGVTPVTDRTSPRTARLMKRLRRAESLPAADQRALLKFLDLLLDSRGRTAPPARPKNTAAKRKAS